MHKSADELILFSDEAGVSLDAQLGLMWGLKGKQSEIDTSSPVGRINLIGFVDPIGGRVIVNSISKGNSDCFIEQLTLIKNANRCYRTITVYVDNARWHKTKKLSEWLKQNQRVRIEYLPKYAPDLNPMERHWWYMRKRATMNTVFENKQDCVEKISHHFINMKRDEIKRLCQI